MLVNKDSIENRIEEFFEYLGQREVIHGSKKYCLENITFLIGINQQTEKRSILIQHFYQKAIELWEKGEGNLATDFYRQLMANCLLFANQSLHQNVEELRKYLLERLDRIYEFVLSKETIFYSEKEKNNFKNIPTCWKEQPIVKKELTYPYTVLPQIYDLLGYSVLYQEKETQQKIDCIIQYVFSSFYQTQVQHGYGIGINQENGFTKSNYFSIGWDLSLSSLKPCKELTMMILLSKITSCHHQEWYQRNIEKYQNYRIEKNVYLFPKEYFQKVNSYWINGLLDFQLETSTLEILSTYVMKYYFQVERN